MTKCDNCDYESPEVTLGDGCPECGKLVGIRVPDKTSNSATLAAYGVESSDEELREAVGKVAQRNFNTLLKRKRKIERKAGYAKPVEDAPDDEETDGGGQGNPPNADPAKVVDPSQQPAPDGDGGDPPTDE